MGGSSKLGELCLGLSSASTMSVYQVRPGPSLPAAVNHAEHRIPIANYSGTTSGLM